jgi:hypothetical protein
MNTDIDLPSGAKLHITLSPFKIAKDLYQAVLEEAKVIRVESSTELDINLLKDLFCMGFSSKKIENCLNECLKRCTYNKLRITEDTFEPVEARQDYISVMYEVAYANVSPFLKNLSAKLSDMSQILTSTPKPKS